MSADATQMLNALVAPLAAGYLELRPIERQRGAGKPEAFHVADYASAARRAVGLGRRCDVYFGVIPRTHEAGRGAADVGPATAVWADLDSPEATIELLSFVEPSIVVGSGSEGHHHAYWLLDAPQDTETVVALNRDLAVHLGADVRATDAARLLRLPGTRNYKLNPPASVWLAALEEHRYSFAELRAAVPLGSTEPQPVRSSNPRSGGKALRRLLDRLNGVQSTASGWTALCPAHDDHNPSLSISEGQDGRVLVYCHAECATEAVLAALDLGMQDLFEDSPSPPTFTSSRNASDTTTSAPRSTPTATCSRP